MQVRIAATAAGLAVCLLAARLQPQELERPPSSEPRAATARSWSAEAVLTQAAGLYYTVGEDALTGFDCAVHPEWRDVFAIANPGTYIRDNDPRLRLLDSVAITLHAAMKQGSKVVWTPPASPKRPFKQEQIDLLEAMRKATEQTLLGFLQFWKPFLDGSTIPRSAQNVRVTPRENGGFEIDSEHAGTSVVERFDSRLVLKEFDVKTAASRVDFAPAYTPTPRGLLVTGFVAHIWPSGAEAGKAQVMRVGLDYAEVDGVWLPSRIDMTLAGTGAFDFRIDRCTLTRMDKAATIGIGGRVTSPPLPHHRTSGSAYGGSRS